jgi:hypothetical protein
LFLQNYREKLLLESLQPTSRKSITLHDALPHCSICVTNVSDRPHPYSPSPFYLGMRMSMPTLASMWILQPIIHRLQLFKAIPYLPRVYRTHMEKFTMISKIGLGKTMPLTQQWPHDPLQCFQNKIRKNNASHSTMITRPITMLPINLRHKTNTSHSHHHLGVDTKPLQCFMVASIFNPNGNYIKF